MNFIKKYWAHFINILFLVDLLVFVFLYGTLNSNILTIVCIIIEILCVIGIWVEIIYFMIKALNSKSDIPKKGIKALFIYLFNVFYIPCFNLKYIIKDPKYKIKNIIYLILSIVLYFIFFFAFLFKIPTLDKPLENPSRYIVDEVSVTVDNGYIKSNEGEFDLYLSNRFWGSNLGLFIYDGNETSVESIFNYQENYFKNSREKFVRFDEDVKEFDNRVVKNYYYDSINNSRKYVYILSTINFNDNDKILFVIQTVNKADFNDYKNYLVNNITSIDSIEE